jgi:hypothetical protein
MNFVASQLDLVKLFVGHFDSGLILVRVQHCLDLEPSARLGTADQIDDRLIIDQRFSSPIQTDKRE